MKYIKHIVVLFLSLLFFFVSFTTNTFADNVCFTDPNTGNWALCTFDPEDPSAPPTCESTGGGGSEEAHECCLASGTSTCEASGGGGGGGGGCTAGYNDCPPNINCTPYASGYHCNTYNINYNSQSLSGWTERACTLGNAQAWCNCCERPNSEGICMIDKVVTYSCCPIGTTSQWYYTYPTPTIYYTTADTCQGQNPSCASGDTRLSTTATSVCGRTFSEEANQWVDKYVYSTTCQTSTAPIKNYVCITQCSTTAPSAPTLITPTNGSTVSSTTVSLTWNNSSQTWGNACGFQNNQFRVYIGTSPSSLGLLGTVGSGTNSTNFNGSTGQTYYWRVDATNGALTTSSSVWSFTINSGPWWQTKDGSATTNNSLSSTVPTGSYFSVVGLGGFPGVPVYGDTFNLSSTPTLISTRSWNADTTTIQPRLFNFSYFKNLIPEDVNDNIVVATDTSLRSNGYPSDGYEWYKSSGSLSIDSDIDFGNRKVIIFVENGDLNINGKINLNDGLGFVGFFVEGDMNINSTVAGTPGIEGIFEVDGNFESGTGSSQLHARGSVAVFGGVSLSRNLSNNANAAELFEFAPDLMFNYPKVLGFRRFKWQEIAP